MKKIVEMGVLLGLLSVFSGSAQAATGGPSLRRRYVMRIVKNKVARKLVLFGCLAFSLGFFPGRLICDEKQGANIIVNLVDRPPASGELLAVREDSLILMDTNLKTGLTIDFKDIKSVRIIRKSQVMLGMLGGFLAGRIISSGIKDPVQITADNWIIDVGAASINRGMTTGAISLGMTVVGALVGGAMGQDKTILIRGKSPLVVKEILWKLRSKARMPDAR